MQIILHLDMNSYFASVEQQANPLLRGRAIGICEHLGGIIIAPSVEAKRAGIVLGTPVWEAVKVCPGIVLLPTDPDKYRFVTEKFMRILQDYSDNVERYSIDEAFADLTMNWDDALLIALEIKQRLRREIGEWVSCSIGVGPNKLIAKIAAEMDGGMDSRLRGNGKKLLDRICVIRPQDVQSLYDRLQLTDVPGIGKRLERALNRLGIFTLLQLRDYPVGNLLNQFGLYGYVLHGLGTLDCSVPIYRPELPKSIGHAYTLPRVIRDTREIRGLMMKLCEKVGRRMRRKGARGNIVHYFDSNFHQQRKLHDYISDGREVYKAVWQVFCSSPIYGPINRQATGIKIMGITISGLTFSNPPEPLWPHLKKPLLAAWAADRINDKYGDWTIYPGRLLGVPGEWAQDTVGFGRMLWTSGSFSAIIT